LESKFKALQFHFHAPSEHTLFGEHADLEMHIVHLYEDGSLGGVIGIMFNESEEESPFLNEISGVFEETKG
jgi:carbonic anhydrase